MAVRADEIAVRGRLTGLAAVRGWLDRESILGPVFVTPALLLILLLVAYPFVMALYFSMSNAFIGRPSEFIGIKNFVRLWEADAFRQTFKNAFVFTGIAVAFKLVMGITLALLLNEQLWFKRLIRGAVLLPWVIPTALSTARADMQSSVISEPRRWMRSAHRIAPPTPPKLKAASALLESNCAKPAAVSIATIQLKPT